MDLYRVDEEKEVACEVKTTGVGLMFKSPDFNCLLFMSHNLQFQSLVTILYMLKH